MNKKPIKVFMDAYCVNIIDGYCNFITDDFQKFTTSKIENVDNWNRNGKLTIVIDTQNTRYTFINPKNNNIVSLAKSI